MIRTAAEIHAQAIYGLIETRPAVHNVFDIGTADAVRDLVGAAAKAGVKAEELHGTHVTIKAGSQQTLGEAIQAHGFRLDPETAELLNLNPPDVAGSSWVNRGAGNIPGGNKAR